MKNNFDIGSFVQVDTRQNVISRLVEREKNIRKTKKITQRELAVRSGVSYASIRRFEKEGEISLSSLSKIALALNVLEDFNQLFTGFVPEHLKDINL